MITDYTTLYQQAKTGNQQDFASGSSDWLAQNQLNQFSNLAPQPPGPEQDLTGMAMTNMNQTLGDVRQSAYQDYMARQLQQLELQKQGTMQTGADRFQQARMAMEQQGALSDTRGLTAGAAVGAQGQLGAQQQLVLNAIERGTMDDLRQLESQGLSLEFAANEWAGQKVEEFKQTSPQFQAVSATQLSYESAVAAFDRAPSDPRAQEALNVAEEQYLRALSDVSGVNFDERITAIATRFGTEEDPYEVLSEEFMEFVGQAAAPRGMDNIAGVGMDLAPAAIAGLVGKKATGMAVAGTKGKLTAGTAGKVVQSLMTSYQASQAVATGTNVVVTTAKVSAITNTKTLASIAKAVGVPAKQLGTAKTAAALKALITKQMGTAGSATVAKAVLGKSAGAALATGKSSLLLAKGAMLLKGGAAVLAAKPILAAAAVAAVGYGLYMGYHAMKKHFGPEEAIGKLSEVMIEEEDNLVSDGMSREEARSIIDSYVSAYPGLNTN